MSEEYDLKKSEKLVGQLYPNLVSKNGRVIDGLHRLKANPKWKSLTLKEVDTDEKFWTARILANTRRDVPFSERQRWFNELAEIYFKQGIKSDGSIVKKVAEVTGYVKPDGSPSSVLYNYLEEKYKSKPHVISAKTVATVTVAKPQTPIEIAKEKLGSDYHKFEVEIEQQLRTNIEEETKEKLRKDPEFIVETIEKSPIILSRLPESAVTREGFYKPVLTQQEAESLEQATRDVEKDLEKRRQDPKVQERAKLVRAWTALGNILGIADNVFCPACGKIGANNLVWKCHPNITLAETDKQIKQRLEE